MVALTAQNFRSAAIIRTSFVWSAVQKAANELLTRTTVKGADLVHLVYGQGGICEMVRRSRMYIGDELKRHYETRLGHSPDGSR